MPAALGLAGPQRQQRRRPIERLNLRLSHRRRAPARAPGAIHVQLDDVAHLLDEQRILRELEVSLRCGWRPNARQMRLTALRLAGSLAIDRVLQCVASRGSVSSVVVSNLLDVRVAYSAGVPGRSSSNKPSSPLEETGPPFTNGLLPDSRQPSHHTVWFALGTSQNDLCAQGQSLRRLRPTNQLSSVERSILGDRYWRDGTSSAHLRYSFVHEMQTDRQLIQRTLNLHWVKRRNQDPPPSCQGQS